MKPGTLLHDLADLFFPRLCPICRQALIRNEEGICTDCLHRLPRTTTPLAPSSPMAQLIPGKIPIERCASYLFFTTPGDARDLIHHIKYHGGKRCGERLGYIYANELKTSGFFDNIDLLIPVPLHPSKERERGYNQSEWIARGIHQATGIPICTNALYHITDTRSQTRKGIYHRWLDTHTAYAAALSSLAPNPHILHIDDVITTGATLLACACALREQGIHRISCLTLTSAVLQ